MNRTATLALALSVGLVACDGDGGGEQDTSTTDTSVDGTPDTTTDVPADTGTDTDAVEDVPGDVTWPPTYATEDVSYINSITIPEVVSDVPTCCKDFGAISRDSIEEGTDEIDNAFATLASALVGLPGMGIDMQAEITTSIENGDLVILLDHRGLESATDTFVLVELSGVFDAGTTYTEADAGTGEYLLERASFTDGESVPTYFFDPAEVESRAMTAGPGEFKIMGTFGFLSFPLVLQESELSGTANIGSGGVSYVNGTISGYALLADVFAELNAVALSDGCACLGITEPVFTETGTGWDSECVADAATLCDGTDESACATLAGDDLAAGNVCSVLPNLLTAATDIDLDGDPSRYEAMSFGLEWTGVTATVNGLEP